MSDDADSEIGRELLWTDLKTGTIVVIHPPGHGDVAFTMWVRAINEDKVGFYSTVKAWLVVNFRGPDDTIVDDLKRKVAVYEYLGEP